MARSTAFAQRRSVILVVVATLAFAAVFFGVTTRRVEAASVTTRYNVVFNGTFGTSGFTITGGREAALAVVTTAGGTVVNDLTKQIGAVTAISANPTFAQQVGGSTLVETVGTDFAWKAFPTFDEAVASGQLTVLDAAAASGPLPGSAPTPGQDLLESQQWALDQICAHTDTQARPGCAPGGSHAIQGGSRLVQVGILDSGFDGHHPDLAPNADCASGRDFVPVGPSVGNPDPCTDNQFHGTHVAGIVAAARNTIGTVGVAPNVTIIPVKVCDAAGYCYASATAAGITYAGDAKFEVINMSFFVDDDQLLESTEFKCMTDPVQRTFRRLNERAIQYARNQGVVPVAALGNSDQDLAHPPEPYENDCEVVPAETQGVVGTMALGRNSQKASYSNYGFGMTDVAAPGGSGTTGNCQVTILSTLPGGSYGCIQGTSMASPHTTGVAALIVSQFGRVANDAGTTDVVMRPQNVENYLQSTVVDIGLPGYDECFGNGRINALRAVLHDTKNVYDPTAPYCPEYAE